eukprot:TRINITY_DN1191_c0_g1_i1.p1 TRINITY_DN1191_c0_g1~~TRINITY_DN1191_c0_g1_i1.p1  ORF type:complete len:171 (+),score=59.28 TRINITY_DN1191_c0_g1_i1:359-871(+)
MNQLRNFRERGSDAWVNDGYMAILEGEDGRKRVLEDKYLKEMDSIREAQREAISMGPVALAATSTENSSSKKYKDFEDILSDSESKGKDDDELNPGILKKTIKKKKHKKEKKSKKENKEKKKKHKSKKEKKEKKSKAKKKKKKQNQERKPEFSESSSSSSTSSNNPEASP